MSIYQDDVVAIDDDGITVTSYLLAGRRRFVSFDDILHAELVPLGFFTGRHQLVGVGPFRPRWFFHWDRRRASKSHAIVLRRNSFLRLALTPSEPERVLAIVRQRIASD